MRAWPELIGRLIKGDDLDRDDTAWAMDQVMSGQTAPTVLAGFLTALATKGETISELRGLADAMLAHARPIDVSSDCLDIVGTGGDRMRTVNISTTAALVIAACGIQVVKHGNRAASSSSGSADCLQALGVNLELEPERVAEVAREVGMTFLFANLFHPSMRHAAVARRELGVPTAFNLLGPLTNPARPRATAIGCFSERQAPIIAGVLAERGTEALVFRGENGMDELSAVARNQVWEVRSGEVAYEEIDASELGLEPATVEDLRGADAEYNASVTAAVLDGQTGPVRDAVLLNAAGGIVADARHQDLTGDTLAERLRSGIDIAAAAIDSGAARGLLDNWVAATSK